MHLALFFEGFFSPQDKFSRNMIIRPIDINIFVAFDTYYQVAFLYKLFLIVVLPALKEQGILQDHIIHSVFIFSKGCEFFFKLKVSQSMVTPLTMADLNKMELPVAATGLNPRFSFSFPFPFF